jgi:hypothetical protein
VTRVKLPSAFAELEPYAETWCLQTETERWNRRLATSMADMREFHDAFFPRLEEAIEYCDKYSLDDMPDDAINLLHLIYSLVMVAMAVQIFKQPKPTDAADAVITRIGEPAP